MDGSTPRNLSLFAIPDPLDIFYRVVSPAGAHWFLTVLCATHPASSAGRCPVPAFGGLEEQTHYQPPQWWAVLNRKENDLTRNSKLSTKQNDLSPDLQIGGGNWNTAFVATNVCLVGKDGDSLT
jgi:hypothetical protein